ncbi:hypothetical protein O9992_00430 [Vibrio lentus]|nr:hypothetical protein [Vibrio lentus]
MLFKLLAQAPYAEGNQWNNLRLLVGRRTLRGTRRRFFESNYGEAKCITAIRNLPVENIHRIRGEDEPKAEAERFAKEMVQT